jgi:hypothetical protein
MAQHENKQSLLKVEEVTLDSGGSATFQGSFHTRLKEIAYITGLPKNIVPASVRIPSFGDLKIVTVKILNPEDYKHGPARGDKITATIDGLILHGSFLERNSDMVKILVNGSVIELRGTFQLATHELIKEESSLYIKDLILRIRYNRPLASPTALPLKFKTNGIQWNTDHRITINSMNRNLDWDFILTTNNQTGLELNDVNVKLIVSDSYKPHYYAAARSLVTAVRGIQESSSGNTIVDIGKMNQIATGESTTLIYSQTEILFESALVYSIREGSKHPNRVITFSQPKFAPMAFPASSGEWNIDESDNGTFNMDYLAPLQVCRLNLGTYSLVEAKVGGGSIVGKRRTTNINFKNHSSQTLNILVELRDIGLNAEFGQPPTKDPQVFQFFDPSTLRDTQVVKIRDLLPGSISTISYTEDIHE